MAVIVAVFALAFVVAQTCQKSEIRLSKEQAIAKAEDQIDFEPRRTQIRLLQQGVPSQPFWVVSLSIPGERKDTFSALAVVRIDANTGKVESVNQAR